MPAVKQHGGGPAFSSYLPRLGNLIQQYNSPRILELGGERKPSFTLAQLPHNVSSYTVNDISAEELTLTPSEYDKALFDVNGDVGEFAGQFEVVFSRTLMEHVRDGQAAHRNVVSLLKPGGVAFHMAPTLHAAPFVLNRLLRAAVSPTARHSLFPHQRSEKPKFPAYYSWCYGNREKMIGMLRKIGYQDFEIINFYGLNYFKKIPIVRSVDRAFRHLPSAAIGLLSDRPYM